MKPILSIITCTRDRPEGIRLYERWMKHQRFDLSRCQLIVVDDGDVPASLTMGQLYIRRERHPYEPEMSLGLNMRAGLKSVEADILIACEDDDYYGPNYLEVMFKWLQTYTIAGTCNALYYNVRDRRYFRHKSADHASLCSTGLRREAFHALNDFCLTNNPFIDLALWRNIGGDFLMPSLTPGWPVSVGMKCVPGRTSPTTINGQMARGERPDFGSPDPDMSVLRSWIGEDAEAYRKFGAK